MAVRLRHFGEVPLSVKNMDDNVRDENDDGHSCLGCCLGTATAEIISSQQYSETQHGKTIHFQGV